MEYMTTREAAAALGISDSAVRRRIIHGDLRAERAGHRVLLIPVAEVERAKREPIKRGPRRRKNADGSRG